MKRRVLFTYLVLAASLGLHAPIFCQNTTPGKSQESSNQASDNSNRRMYRNPQRAPTKARYKEIQTALAQQGYNPGPIDGDWGSKSSAALKRFEKANGLRADGKLDSLALIILGLGPKRPPSVSK